MIKVRGGTRSDGVNLCTTCRYSTIIKGSRESAEFVHCGQINKSIHIKVVECNSYDDKNKTSLYDLGKIAWVLDGDKKKDKIGFMSPKEFRNVYKKNPTDDFDD